MLYVLLGLLTALSWGLWFVLQTSAWIPAAATGLLGVAALAVFTVRRVSAKRSAAALEKALAEQGAAQAKSTEPDKRAEIEALQAQMAAGMAALRESNVGGKRRGATAMYALPWYAIIGPPGAGKTTALRHSGLSFPHTDHAVRGVGGTRNCDWWFTNEAILLDTAGRYATDGDDRREWLAFLDILREHRIEKPLNGLIVAVALPDVIDADDAAIEAMGHKLRQRIDEVMTRLRMTLPVYVLVTKCDLVAGFVELFGSLKRSERAQAWGATIPLDADKSDPGAIFAREIDLLVEGVHGRAVRRLASERDRRARESIYQFPIEMAAVKHQLRALVSRVFAPNAFQATPTFRGFYFTSGTQEGAPHGRVVERMGRAMGIGARAGELPPRLEPKSYFLHDVFTKVVFPDAEIAARSAAEVRRQRFVRLAIAATALAVAGTIVGPSVRSYQNNVQLIADARASAATAASIDWESSDPLAGKLDALRPLFSELLRLDGFERDGAPLAYRFSMYTGDEVHQPLVQSFASHMEKSFVETCQLALERRLVALDGKRYHRDHETLKVYLMLSDRQHLDVEWAAPRLTLLWSEAEVALSDVKRGALRQAMRPFVDYYLTLLASGGAKPRAFDAEIVARARDVLARVPVAERYDSLFVYSLDDALYDPADDHVVSNMQFPPLTLDSLFSDRPEVLRHLRSKRRQASGRAYAIPGPFTDKGHYGVLANIIEARALLTADAWVVPLSDDEKGDRLGEHVAQLANRYEETYIRHWQAFFADIEVVRPHTLAEAVRLYEVLLAPEWPYLRLIRALEDHTQWTRGIDELTSNAAATRLIETKVNTAFSRRVKGLRAGFEVGMIAERASLVPPAFAKSVRFGVPQKGKNLNTTSLHQYMQLVDSLANRMTDELSKSPTASPNTVALATKKTIDNSAALLPSEDPVAKRLLSHLLLAPLELEP